MSVTQNLTVTQKSRDFAGNYSNVQIKLTSTQSESSHNGYSRTGYYYVSINGGAEKKYSFRYTLPQNTTKMLVDTTIVVPHRADGTGTIKVRTWVDTDISAGIIQKTSTVTLVSIPRATTPTFSAANADIGAKVTIKTNRAADSFTHTLTYTFGKATGTIGSSVETSKEWVVPSELANQIPNATSGTCVITCKTYNGSALVGTKTANLTLRVPTTVVPVIKSVSVSEGMDKLKNNFTVFVQNNSAFAVSVDAVGAFGSSISKIETQIQDTVYNGNAFVSAIVTASGNVDVVTAVTDSRGRKATITKTVTVEEYTFPTIYSMSVQRIDTSGNVAEDGERISVYMHYSTSAISNAQGEQENPRTYKLQYKKNDAVDFNTFESGAASLIHAQSVKYKTAPIISNDYSYIIRLEITDFFKTVICDVELPTAYTLIDFNASGKGIAFGKVSEKDGMEINMPTELMKGLDVHADAQSTIAKLYAKDGTLVAEVNKIDNGLELCMQTAEESATKITIDQNGEISVPAISYLLTPADNGVNVERATVACQGNIVTVYANITCSSSINSGTAKQIGSIPAVIAPGNSLATVGIQGNTGECSAWIRNDGTIWIRPHTAASSNTTFEFTIVYNKGATWNAEMEG